MSRRSPGGRESDGAMRELSLVPSANGRFSRQDRQDRQGERVPIMKKTPLLLFIMALTACSGGDPVATTTGTDQTGGCTGTCGGSTTSLTVADVQQVIAQAVAEAQARGVNATIAVVDRVGNVLAVYRMGSAATRTVTITTSPSGAT